MCFPPAVLGIAAIAGGTALSAISQIQAGNYAAAAGQANATTLRYAARDAENRGEIAQQQVGQQVGQLAGTQRARMAAGGIDIQSGSALDTLVSTNEIGLLDQMTVRNNAAREAWGLRAQAQQELAAGRQARRQSRFGAGATILTGLGQLTAGIGGANVGF